MKRFNMKGFYAAMLGVLLIFALAGCEQGSGGGSGRDSIVYTSTTKEGGKQVVLTITKKEAAANILASNHGAPVFAHVPKSGDTYTIRIGGEPVSSGTVTVDGATLTFSPDGGGSSFTANITKEDGSTLSFKDGINTADGIIKVEDATTTTPPYKDEPITIPSDTGGTKNPPSTGGGYQPPIGGEQPPPAPIVAPVLQSTSVSYADGGTAATVSFTFDMGVTLTASDGGIPVTGSGTATLTASPARQVAGTPITVSLTAANPRDGTKTTEVEATIMPVSRAFSRATDAGTCTVAYCDEYGAARIIPNGGAAKWVYLEKGSPEHRMFYAVYTPNAPGSTDTIENGRRALAYTDEISAAVLALFHITIGAASVNDRVEVSGTALPTAEGANAGNIIIIDIGAGAADTGAAGTLAPLPFYIPHKGLGEVDGNYESLRLRVNGGAYLRILADNAAYIAGGAGHPCPYGYFGKGTVEVMGGGRLRDGAYEGFPLGENTVIIPRLGSYLAVGPEDTDNEFFTGWLLGPQDSDARILLDGGDQSAGYMEIREGALALAANVTVRKPLGLLSSVWFIGGAKLTVDIPAANAMDGNRGLFANGGDFRFYGLKSEGNGQITNPGNSIIEVKAGSYIDGRFFEAESTDAVIPLYGQRTIKNQGSGGGNAPVPWTGKIATVNGYPDWDLGGDTN